MTIPKSIGLSSWTERRISSRLVGFFAFLRNTGCRNLIFVLADSSLPLDRASPTAITSIMCMRTKVSAVVSPGHHRKDRPAHPLAETRSVSGNVRLCPQKINSGGAPPASQAAPGRTAYSRPEPGPGTLMRRICPHLTAESMMPVSLPTTPRYVAIRRPCQASPR